MLGPRLERALVCLEIVGRVDSPDDKSAEAIVISL